MQFATTKLNEQYSRRVSKRENEHRKEKEKQHSLCSLIVTQRSQAHDVTVTPHTVVAAMKIAASLTESASHTGVEILLQALFSD